MNIRGIASVVRKEFRQIMRDRKMKGALFLSPVLMLLVFGYAVSTDIREVPIAVNDQSMTPESRALIDSITASRYFVPVRSVRRGSDGVKELNASEVEVYLEIPPTFASDTQRRMGSVNALIDGTDPNRATIISGYLQIIVRDYGIDKFNIRQRGVPQMRERIFFNEDLESRNYFLPCLLALLIGLITIMLTSMSIVKEREDGTMDQISVAPISAGDFIIGKVILYSLIALLDMMVITTVLILWFNVPFRGSFPFLIFSGLIFTICNMSVGIFISSSATTQQQAMLSTFLFFLPSILLSGFMFPVHSMPFSVQLLTYLNPMRYFIEIIRGVFLKGGGFDILYMKIVPLIIIASVLLLVSSFRLRRGIE